MGNNKEIISNVLIKYVENFYKKFGFFDTRIITDWEDIIIDKDIHKSYYPVRMIIANKIQNNYILYVSKNSQKTRNLRQLSGDFNYIKNRINDMLFSSADIIYSVKLENDLQYA